MDNNTDNEVVYLSRTLNRNQIMLTKTVSWYDSLSLKLAKVALVQCLSFPIAFSLVFRVLTLLVVKCVSLVLIMPKLLLGVYDRKPETYFINRLCI